jgi:hypothetical protein
MVAYVPPDHVLLAIGAAYRSAPLLEAARRLLRAAEPDAAALARFGITEDDLDLGRSYVDEIESILGDKRAQKNDTPLPMTELAEAMARARGWLRTLRLIAAVNLAADTPALLRVASVAPDLVEGYPRDLTDDFERRVGAAADLKPRLEEAGLSEAFLTRGRRLAQQLRTAIGKEDLDGANLPVLVRRLYARKGQLYLRLKRMERAGQLAFMLEPERARLYHLEELEPTLLEPAPGAQGAQAPAPPPPAPETRPPPGARGPGRR